MPHFPKHLGNISLAGCGIACLFVAALNLAEHSLPTWGGEDLWLLAPHVAMIVIAGIAWRSRFWSLWVLACGIAITILNPAVWLLIGVHFGREINDSTGWYLFIGPIIAWNIMGGFLIAAVIVRVVLWVLGKRDDPTKDVTE